MSITEEAVFISLLLQLDYLVFQADVICFLLFEKHHSRVTGGRNQNRDICWRRVKGINFSVQKKSHLSGTCHQYLGCERHKTFEKENKAGRPV